MAACDWEEIKRLASDFHRIQLTSSAQKLSERNCIEIVQRLIDLKLLDVIYTTDGKEYLTQIELSKEILEELIVSGGRINLVDLQKRLNVDLSHIETKVSEILRADRSLKIVLGQLISRDYFNRLSEEINERLQQQGLVRLSDLAKKFDLPGEILKELVKDKLGTSIKGSQDSAGNDLYTEAYFVRHRAIIRGAMTAITRPTSVSSIITKYKIQEALFYHIAEKLISDGHLQGSLSGVKPYNVVYTPHVYTKIQNDWVDSFYSQNSYLEFDGLVRMGISDPVGYVKKKYQNERVEYLKTCLVGSTFIERIESELEVALESGVWFDVSLYLPAICTDEDAVMVVDLLMKKKLEATVLGGGRYIVGNSFILSCIQHFKPMITEKAEQTIRENPSILMKEKQTKVSDEGLRDSRKDQRRKKAAGGKSGGGTQGREVKTKSIKKKTFRHKDDDSEEDGGGDFNVGGVESAGKKADGTAFMTINELSRDLSKLPSLLEAPQHLLESLAVKIIRDLNAAYTEELKNIFVTTLQTSTDSSATGSSNKKKFFAEMSEKVATLWCNAKLFEKGIPCFKDEIHSQLAVHLLKTICTDITNAIFAMYGSENMITFSNNENVTVEERLKVLNSISDDETKSLLTRLNSSLNLKSLDDFFLKLENICTPHFLNITLKTDSKKNRQIQSCHKQTLLKKLEEETADPASVLHICSVLLFQHSTHSMLHASGKFVPHIISFLKNHLNPDHHQLLVQCQDAVIKSMKMSSKTNFTDDEKQEHTRLLELLVPQIKNLPMLVQQSTANLES